MQISIYLIYTGSAVTPAHQHPSPEYQSNYSDQQSPTFYLPNDSNKQSSPNTSPLHPPQQPHHQPHQHQHGDLCE